MRLIQIDRKGRVGLLCRPEGLTLLHNYMAEEYTFYSIQDTEFASFTKLLFHSSPTWLLFAGLEINGMKIPTVSVFNQIPLAVCACQRMCLKTHKPQTKQRLLKTRAVPELITNITLFGPTKPSFTPPQTPFLCTCVQVTSSTCIESCPVLRNGSCRVVAADGMTLLFIQGFTFASLCGAVLELLEWNIYWIWSKLGSFIFV